MPRCPQERGCRRLRGFASGDPAPAEQLLSVVQAFSSLDWVFGYMIALLQGLQGKSSAEDLNPKP